MRTASPSVAGLLGLLMILPLLGQAQTPDPTPDYEVIPLYTNDTSIVGSGFRSEQGPRLNNLNQVMIRYPNPTNTDDDSLRIVIISGDSSWQPVINFAPGVDKEFGIQFGLGFNDSGQVTGWQTWADSAFNTFYEAFVADRNGYTVLSHPDPTFFVETYDINNNGDVVGRATLTQDEFFNSTGGLVVWESGGRTSYTQARAFIIDTAGAFYRTIDVDRVSDWDELLINNAGQVAGNMYVRPDPNFGFGQDRGFTLNIDPFTIPSQIPLFPEAGVHYAVDLSNNGLVVGRGFYDVDTSAGINLESQAFIYDGDSIRNIHPADNFFNSNSGAYAVNARGEALLFGNETYIYTIASDTTRALRDLNLIWENDTTYLDQFGNPLQPFINTAFDINDNGVILSFVNNPLDPINFNNTLCLLVPVQDAIVINSTGDLPDENPGDGKCSTGQTIAGGDDECTCRAAIEESNVRAGLDILEFNIQGTSLEIPITAANPLPPITDSVEWDWASQPGDEIPILVGPGLIELAPGQSPPTASSAMASANDPVAALTLKKWMDIENVRIAGFDGHGILVDSSEFTFIKGAELWSIQGNAVYVRSARDGTSEDQGFFQISDSWIGVERKVADRASSFTGKVNIGGHGVFVDSTFNGNVSFSAQNNVIVGTTLDGIHVNGVSSDTIPIRVNGCKIGIVDDGSNGVTPRPQAPISGHGVFLRNVSAVIGTAAFNMIGTTVKSGIYIESGDSLLIENNQIGMPLPGDTVAPAVDGITAAGKISDLYIRDNTVRHCGRFGVGLVRSDTFVGSQGIDTVFIGGNSIGTDGIQQSFNDSCGIYLGLTAAIVYVGSKEDGNTIVAGPGQSCLTIDGAGLVTVRGNRIGIRTDLAAPLGQQLAGITFRGGVATLIGNRPGVTTDEGNIIGGCFYGILLEEDEFNNGIRIMGNAIGTSLDGTQNLGNWIGIEVRIDEADIGGSKADTLGNLFKFNSDHAIVINEASETGIIGNTFILNGEPTLNVPGQSAIEINGSDNFVGSFFDASDSGNSFIDNRSTGVTVVGGENNLIAGNIFKDNLGMAIDLSADGVTENDGSDADTGPNGLLNYAIIDSVVIIDDTATQVWLKYQGLPNTRFAYDFYRSVTPDSTTYGEGEELYDFGEFTTNSNGFYFQTYTFPGADLFGDSAFLSVLVHNYEDPGDIRPTETSEFSKVWPAKIIRLVDGRNVFLNEMEFKVAKPSYNSGTREFDQNKVKDLTTDVFARLLFSDVQMPEGDSISVRKRMEPAIRAEISNLRFDETGKPHYDTIDNKIYQTIELTHSLFDIDLSISTEWEPAPEYYVSLQDYARALSNLLFDVTDGQVKLDTVKIYTDRDMWEEADVHVLATNNVRPSVIALRYISGGLRVVESVKLPRMYAGTVDSTVEASVQPTWTVKTPDFLQRSLGPILTRKFKLAREHTFGVAFFDERCNRLKFYGILDRETPVRNDPRASELANDEDYRIDDCRNTWHYVLYDESPWRTLESQLEKVYNGIQTTVIRPGERTFSGGEFRLVGPNDNGGFLGDPFDGSTMDIDVGKDVVFPFPPLASRLERDFLVRLSDPSNPGEVQSGVEITLKSIGYPDRLQGVTSSDSRIRVLGVPNLNATLRADKTGLKFTELPSSSGAASIADTLVTRDWLSGELEINASNFNEDSLDLPLARLTPELRQLFPMTLSTTDAELTAEPSRTLAMTPAFEQRDDNGTNTALSPAQAGDDYSVTLTLSADSSQSGTIVQTITNDSGTWAVPVDYQIAILPPSGTAASLELDGALMTIDTGTSVERLLLAATAFPPPATDEGNKTLAGKAFSIASYPASSHSAGSSLLLPIDSADVPLTVSLADDLDRATVAIWDEGVQGWRQLPSIVDSAFMTVTALLEGDGVYALVFGDVVTDVGDDDGEGLLPNTFALDQNYPNPFNPTTTISFTLPQSGDATLTVYNLLGQQVATLVSGKLPAGEHTVTWNGQDAKGNAVASGVYFYRLVADENVRTRKMMLVK